MNFEFHPDALSEYENSIDYYLNINKDLAKLFVNEIEDKIRNISKNPKLYPILKKDIRRALLNKFPYGILYSLEKENNSKSKDKILILAITHCSRKPNYWKKRI